MTITGDSLWHWFTGGGAVTALGLVVKSSFSAGKHVQELSELRAAIADLKTSVVQLNENILKVALKG